MENKHYDDRIINQIMRFWFEIPALPDRPLNVLLLKKDFEYIQQEMDRLLEIERAAKRLAYIVRKSVNSGPISNDPTQEGQAWEALWIALGE